MMWNMDGGWGWWMASGWLWMIILAALIVWGVSAMTGSREGQPPPRPRGEEPSALAVLERRYAMGELSDEQFEQMRQRLQRPPGA